MPVSVPFSQMPVFVTVSRKTRAPRLSDWLDGTETGWFWLDWTETGWFWFDWTRLGGSDWIKPKTGDLMDWTETGWLTELNRDWVIDLIEPSLGDSLSFALCLVLDGFDFVMMLPAACRNGGSEKCLGVWAIASVSAFVLDMYIIFLYKRSRDEQHKWSLIML